jgi:pimeloyl-ACP methyl ester carboxylesterase
MSPVSLPDRRRRGARSIRQRAAAALLAIAVASPLTVSHASQTATGGADIEKLDSMMDFVRARNARDYAITSPNLVDEARYVRIGGIEQWITIRGEDRRNPVVLFLHGGPGDATNPWGYAGFRLWLKHFTVVQWDQRGAARTLGKNRSSPASLITLNRMVQDGIELSEWLRTSLGKGKIVLVGHSFGSILGVLMAKARPELFYAFVGTGQVGDPSKNYAVAYGDLLKKAEAIGDQHAAQELRQVGPPPYADGRGYGVQRKWSNLFEGADAFIASMVGFALGAPGYTLHDVYDWFDGQGVSAERLVPETSTLAASALAGEFSVPVFVIQGADDFTTPASLARGLVDAIRAPSKAYVPIEGGHFAVFMKPAAFLEQLRSRVLPIAGSVDK